MALRRASRQNLFLLSIGALFLIISLHMGLRARLQRRIHLNSVESGSLLYIPSGDVLEVLSLGYRTFITDLLWIGSLQVFDSTKKQFRSPHHIAAYGDAMIHLDPDFKPAYRWIAITLLFASGKVDPVELEMLNGYLAMAMERFPDDPYYPHTMGTNYVFWSPNSDVEVKRRFVLKGISYLEIAAQLEGPDSETPGLIAGLLKYSADPESSREFLMRSYLTTANPETKARLEHQLRMLQPDGAQSSAFELERRRQQHRAEQHYPYISPGLFSVVGEHVRDAHELRSLLED